MRYLCPKCGIAGYTCEKRLIKHMRNNCPGRGWKTRLKANGDIRTKLGANSLQDGCSRRTSVQSEKLTSKKASNLDPLPSGKVRRKAPKSTHTSGDQISHFNRPRRSSLRSAQSEILTNDQPGISEDFSSKSFSKEEIFANPPSEVSSSHESLPISVRMSTRMRTMSSTEQKRAKEAGSCNPVSPGQLGTKTPKGRIKHSPKIGRKNTSSNFAISSRNTSLATAMELKKKSLSHKISKQDSSRNLKKSRPIATKSVESTICASGNSGASGGLKSSPRSSNATNSLQKAGKLSASSVKSDKSTAGTSKRLRRSHGPSTGHGSLNVPPDPKESHSSAGMGNKSAGEKKKGHAKLKVSGSIVHHRMSQNRACKKAVAKDLSVDKNSPFGSAALNENRTEASNEFAGDVLQGRVGSQSTDQSGILHKTERGTSTAEGSSSNAPSSLELLVKPTKRSSRKLIGELSGIDCKGRTKVTKLGNNSIALKNQPSSKGSIGVDGKKELGTSPPPRTIVMLTGFKQSESSKPLVGVSQLFFPTLNASVKLEMITDKSKTNVNFPKKPAENVVKPVELKSDDLTKGYELATEAKSLTTERAHNDDVEMLIVTQNRCDIAQVIKPESSEASMDKGSEFRYLREALGANEMPKVSKRPTSVKPTGSTANAMNSTPKATFAAAAAVATPTSVTASTTTVSTTTATSSLTGKVALVDWDCFIAKDPRKARCNSVAITTAPTTPTKSPLKSQRLPSVNPTVVAHCGPGTSTSQVVEQRSPRHPKKLPAVEVSVILLISSIRLLDRKDPTSPSSRKQATDVVNSDSYGSGQARICDSSMSGSMQLFVERINAEHATFATPSKFNEELSSKRISASSLDSALPMNDDGRVSLLLIVAKPKASDINTFGSSSSVSNRVCDKGNEIAAQNVVPPLPSHDNSDSNSEATAPAVNSGQDLLISPASNRQAEDNQAFRKRLRPRKSIDYFESTRRSSKRIKVEEVENEVVSKNESAKRDAWKDEDDEEEVSQGNNESKGKYMTTHCCPVCRLTGFATLAELKVHRTISCRKKLKKKKGLKRRTIEWYCPGCPTTQGPFESAAVLLTHLLTCRTKKSCGGKVKANHPALSVGPSCPSTLLGPSTTFGCSICGVIVASESRLDKHRRDEHNY
ncbi:unnamed protein product [Taenia asiatica]|uniref:C2H2-type domain-containing protein n=1 Tax=Taenia asiatica TaxID=60517 RepID=A0A0R3WE45_TAEAS|nr:unnamed protein product [Taenia asiatica]